MPNIRILPPGNKPSTTTVLASGRSYTAALNAVIDAPDFDVYNGLQSNGWTVLGMVGTTAQRPIGGLPAGIKSYIDTTLNAAIFWDGANWRTYAGAVA